MIALIFQTDCTVFLFTKLCGYDWSNSLPPIMSEHRHFLVDTSTPTTHETSQQRVQEVDFRVADFACKSNSVLGLLFLQCHQYINTRSHTRGCTNLDLLGVIDTFKGIYCFASLAHETTIHI